MFIEILTLISSTNIESKTTKKNIESTLQLKSNEFITATVHPRNLTASQILGDTILCFSKGKVYDSKYTTQNEMITGLEPLTEYPIKLGDAKLTSMWRSGLNGGAMGLGALGCSTAFKGLKGKKVKGAVFLGCGFFLSLSLTGEGPLRANARHVSSLSSLFNDNLINGNDFLAMNFASNTANIRGMSTAIKSATQVEEVGSVKLEKCSTIIEEEKVKALKRNFSCSIKKLKKDARGKAKIFLNEDFTTLISEEDLIDFQGQHYIKVNEEVINSSGRIAYQVQILSKNDNEELVEAVDDLFWIDSKYFENAWELFECEEQEREYRESLPTLLSIYL